MKLFLALALLVVGASASGVQLEPELVTMAPSGKMARHAQALWTMDEKKPVATATITVNVMLKHEAGDVAALEETLYAVSDPNSPKYGQHLSKEALADLVPISDDKIKTVTEFFKTANSAKTTLMMPGRDLLSVTLTVADAEALLETTIRSFTHAARGITVLRSEAGYSVPAEVAECIYVVGDLANLPGLMTPFKTGLVGGAGTWPNACTGLSSCQGLITPSVLKQRYSVPNTTEEAAKKMNVVTNFVVAPSATANSMSVSEFQGQGFEQSDIDTFNKGCGVNVTVTNNDGGSPSSAGVESELDIEFIAGVSPNIPLTVLYDSEYSLLKWATSLVAMANPPLVNSVSYGNDEKQQSSTAYMFSCNVQFMKAGTAGLSILFASGDQGVCGRSGCGFFKKRFKPDFPGGSPFITVVGGTDFVTDAIGDETAWSSGGGGFSDTFPIPDYQAKLVAAYKAAPDAKLPKASMWNNTGRGYPDIAALGGQKTPYCVVTMGKAEGVAGTSASCPTASSIFARLNGLRLASGGKPLGFLNPFIYQNSDAFNDVTSGCNYGTAIITKTNCFTAIKGWDAATGVGTPNYAELAKRI